MKQPKVIEVEGLGNVEFPGDMDDAAISAVIEQELAKQKPASPNQDELRRSSYLSNTLWNIPQSGADFAGRIASAVSSPIQTGKALGSMAAGAGEKMMRNTVQNITGAQLPAMPHEPAADAVADFYRKRYGSLDAAKNTLGEDPVGTFADISTLLTGAGTAAKIPALAGIPGAAKVSRAALSAGRAVDPLTAPAAVAGKAASGLFNFLPQRLYASALSSGIKPSVTPQRANALVKRGIDDAIIVPTKNSVGKIQNNISRIDDAMDTAAKSGAAQGLTVDPVQAAGAASKVSAKFDKMPPNRLKNLDDVRSVQGEFLADPNVGLTPVPVDKALEIRRGIGKALDSKIWDEAQPAMPEAWKAIYGDINDQFYGHFPELRALGQNAKESIDLKNAVLNALKNNAKKQLTSGHLWRAGLGGVIGSSIGGFPGAGAGSVISVLLEIPTVKSALAIALDRANKIGTTAGPAASAVRRTATPVSTLNRAASGEQ